jgi:hypothetical protein
MDMKKANLHRLHILSQSWTSLFSSQLYRKALDEFESKQMVILYSDTFAKHSVIYWIGDMEHFTASHQAMILAQALRLLL